MQPEAREPLGLFRRRYRAQWGGPIERERVTDGTRPQQMRALFIIPPLALAISDQLTHSLKALPVYRCLRNLRGFPRQ